MKRICAVLLFLSVPTMGLQAAFKDNGWGTRPGSMGGAFTAIADDANAMLYNPSGIMQVACPEVNFMYSRLYAGLDEVNLGMNYFSCVYPLRGQQGAFGVNWANFTANDLYREDTATLSYAYRLNNMYLDLKNEYLIGGNLKYLRNSFNLDARASADPVFASGSSADAFAVDLGFLANFYEESIGFSVKNLNEPDVGLKTNEPVYREYRLGFAYLLGNFWKIEEAVAAVEGSFRNHEFEYHVGWENWFSYRTFALRFGTNRDEMDMGFGYVQYLGSSGIELEFDYALLWPLTVEDTAGSHRFSVNLRFGGPLAEPKKQKVSAKKTDSVPIQKARNIVTLSKVKQEERGLIVHLSTRVLFETGRSTLKRSALLALDELVALLQQNPKNRILIEGHTDDIGPNVLNEQLSENRAFSVYTYFAQKGIDTNRIKVKGFGETRPIASNESSQGREQNRRVEVVILNLTQ